ncbi:beta-2-glycoprotein 1-like [Mercenaria mercenaria]|uniref:beta-2-glycoprotein 1-like n=1 Tax=Mercenaria mercenaria TaxID=6596 RepID=UPI00234E6CBC|nr:beta-2-glycoprotein 1-like [Mercenaria mercenaria]
MQPHTNQENVQHDGNTRSKNNRRRKKVCIVKVVAVITLLVVTLVVMANVFLSSKQQGVSCPIHTNISNGQIIRTTGSRQGDILEIKCGNNSKLNGSSPVICLSSGMWSASTDCISKDCGRFPLKQNMIANSGINRTAVGSMISLSCIEGFILSGNKSIICQTNEMWAETPTCKPVDCGPPKNVTNSRQLDIVKTTYNNSFTVECIRGYALIGSKTVTCDKHGQWDALPDCKIVSCGIPNLPAHASLTNLTGTTFQSNMSMKCDEGYLLHGNPVIWCTSSGKWTALPTCKPLDTTIP